MHAYEGSAVSFFCFLIYLVYLNGSFDGDDDDDG